MESKYIRVGTTYFKRTKRGLQDWSRQTIIDDFDKGYLKNIEKYDAFCNEPSHTNYKKVIDEELNMYSELTHVPKKGDCDTILGFIKHVFGDQHELGLDYIQMLYTNPKHLLPILCLVSNERGTGKTTFGYFLTWLFQDNATKVNQKQLATEFNGSYADKLVAFVDESLVKSSSILENLKDLSTAKTIGLRKMRSDHVEVPFYCKFVMMSNHTDTFINVDKEEIRYWIRVLKPAESFSPNFEEDIKAEIPAFLYMLSKREMFTKEKRTRMWFSADQLNTDALETLKHSSISDDAKTFLSWMYEICVNESLTDELRTPVKSIVDDCFNKRLSASKCRLLIKKMFPDYTETKKARINIDNRTDSLNCYQIPVSLIEAQCVDQGYCKKGDLVGLPDLSLDGMESREVTEDEISVLEESGLLNQVP